MYVNMPVRCLDKNCINCQNLEISIEKTIFYSSVKEVGAENEIYCKNWRSCTIAYNIGVREGIKEAKGK